MSRGHWSGAFSSGVPKERYANIGAIEETFPSLDPLRLVMRAFEVQNIVTFSKNTDRVS